MVEETGWGLHSRPHASVRMPIEDVYASTWGLGAGRPGGEGDGTKTAAQEAENRVLYGVDN